MKIKTLLRLGQGILGLVALGLGSGAGASNFDLRFINPGNCPAATNGANAAVGSSCRYLNVVADSSGNALPVSSIYQRDVIIKLEKLVGGAIVKGTATNSNAWDNDSLRLNGATTGPTYPQFFTPTVTAPNTANTTSWAEFSFQFVAPDGSSSATLPLPGAFYMTSFDTDTNGAALREFIEYLGASGSGLASPTSDKAGAAVDGGTNYEAIGTGTGSGIADDPLYKASAQFSTPGLVKFVVGVRQGATSCNANNNATNGSCERLSAYSFQIADSVFLSPNVDGYKSVKLTDADGNNVVSAGDTLTYTVTYINTGNAAVSNFQITDALPTGLTATAGAQTVTGATKNGAYTGTGANTGLLATGQTLAVNGSITVTIPVTVGTVAADNTVLSNQTTTSGNYTNALGGSVTLPSVSSDNVDNTNVFPSSVTAATGFTAVPGSSIAQTQASSIDSTKVTVRLTRAISGQIYEDYNYGGGAGRAYLAASGMSLRPSVRVELYSNAGAYITSALTNASGAYTFAGQLPGTYKVRVVNSFVTSSRTGGCAVAVNVSTPPASCTQLPVQTYINGASQVGGANLTGTDPALSTGTLPAGAQSVASVTVDSSDVANVDFGFNFDTIVNTNDTGQGSLRQFVTNSNALLGNSSLVQVGQTPGRETSIFMVPTAALTGGVAIINLASILDVTDSDTSIDATTQTANTTTSTGDTNTGALGTGGLVGVDNLPLGQVNRPEVEITLASGSLQVSAANFTLRGVALHGSNELVLGTGTNAADNALIEKNVFGTTAKAFALPASLPSAQYGINVVNGSGTIQNNLIGYSAVSGINYLGGGVGLIIQNNEFQQSGYVSAGGDAITLTGSTTAGFAKPVTITGNLIASSNSSGIQFEIGSVANNTVANNTITANGRGGAATRLEGSGIHYLARNATVNSTNSDTITKNVIYNNLNSGVVVNFGQKNVAISQNSFYMNGLTSIDFTASDGYVNGNANYGQGNGVTPNDGATVAREGNTGQDYPVFTVITLGGGILDVTGYVGNGTSTSFDSKSAVIEIYKADDDGNQNGAVLVGDGKSVPHGEGKTYLGTLTVTLGAKGAFSGTLPAGAFTANDSLTATATIVGNTSEFSPNIKQAPRITLLKLGRNSTQNTTFVDQNGTVGAKPGDTVEYCIAYSNAGSDALNFKLTDNVPVGMNALTDGYVVSKGVRWADGTVIAAGATAAPTGSDLTSTDTDSDKGSLTSTGGLGKGIMTLDLGAIGLAAGGKGTVCFRAKVP
ncbi:right-handed parallel beta-helix repeat-containing protein [Deinococcus sp. AJ005]|uniref:right-handed parallel beta-helix repeat-containing protein n=1 Tax=Deinococcus sp. AJ005 TaxID=2652443 RepID=UPI00125CA8FA|nr:right-handed parallel beta-helix repeat-containing protein [Deinococcus sp. AJ005]QFP75469.1 DUF11 domain-containing protein [Deinococcus sp. AJ005]